MGNHVVGGRLPPSASEAVHLILHHVHGGLHNAAMSLQLAGEAGANGAPAGDQRLVAQSGLEGIAQAARGISLLTVLFGLNAGPGAAPADRRWVDLVESLLRERASARGVDVAIEPDLAGPSGAVPDADRLVEVLLDGIAAIDAANAGQRLSLPRAAVST